MKRLLFVFECIVATLLTLCIPQVCFLVVVLLFGTAFSGQISLIFILLAIALAFLLLYIATIFATIFSFANLNNENLNEENLKNKNLVFKLIIPIQLILSASAVIGLFIVTNGFGFFYIFR